MQNNFKNKNEGGFIQLIILIVIVLLTMRHYGVTIDSAIAWVKSLDADKVIALIKEFVNWCGDLLNSIWK
jgi:hypothetical protein